MLAAAMLLSKAMKPAKASALSVDLPRAADPHLAHHLYVDNDSPGSIYTAAGPAGGMVIISGTGSMAQVIDSAGVAHNCGGWGHMFGDGECSRRAARATRADCRC